MIKDLLLVVVFCVIAILVGSILVRWTKEKNANLFTAIVYGSISMLSLFELLVIPMTIMGQSLSALTIVWAVLIGVISLIGIFSAKKLVAEQILILKKNKKLFHYLDAVIVVLILIQIAVCMNYVFTHANDAYYVGMTTTTLRSDHLLSYSPYTGAEIHWSNYKTHLIAALPVFWAMLANVFQVSGAYFCHTVVPVLFIPITYMLYREIGVFLFKQDKKAVRLFLIVIGISNFFIGMNEESSYEMLSTTIWQGGTFLYQFVLPGIFYFELKLFQKNKNPGDIILFFMILLVGAMTVPLSGGVLSVMLAVVLELSYAIEKLWTRRKRMDAGINF